MTPVACRWCGQTWEAHPALAVPCPRCDAPVGSPCKRPSEHATFGGVPHVERERQALEDGILEMCPEGPTARAERDGDASGGAA